MTDSTDASAGVEAASAKEGRWNQFGSEYDLPLFEGTPRTWVMASTGRSGSHYLGHLLTETGALGAPLEYLHPQHIERWQRRLGVDDLEGVLAYLHAHRTSPSGWFGIKAHWRNQFVRFVKDPDLLRELAVERYVSIRRRDRVAQAISMVMARQTRAWISFHTAKAEPQYDADAIRKAITGLDREVETWDAFFADHGVTPLIVEYEDLQTDPDGTVDRVLSWFDVERRTDAQPHAQQPARQANELNDEWKSRFLAES